MIRAALLLFLVASLLVHPASAEPRPMSPVDMIEMPRLSNGTLSPDGRHFAYLRSETNWSENRIIHRLKLIDQTTGAPIETMIVPAVGESDSRVWWNPDSSGFIFLKQPEYPGSDRVDQQAFFYHLEHKTETQLTAHGEAVLDVHWSPDGAGFYFVAAQLQPRGSQRLLKSGWLIAPFESNANRDVWYFDLATQSARSVVSGAFSVRQVSVSRDGSTLTYSRLPDHRFDSAYRGEVFVWHRDTGNLSAGPEMSMAKRRLSCRRMDRLWPISPPRMKMARRFTSRKSSSKP